MIQKQGNWVRYELTPRNVERWFFACEMLLVRHKRKGFVHRIVFNFSSQVTTCDEKLIHYDNPKRKKSWGPPVPAWTSIAKPNIHGKELLLCIWRDQLGVVYYELLKPNETIIGAVYRIQLMRLSRALKEKRAHYYSRHDKVILLHDNTRLNVAAPVKTCLEHSSGKFHPTRRIHKTLLLLISTYFDRWRMTCLSSTSHHMKIPNAARKMRRTSDKRWTILWIKHKVPFFHNKCPIFDKRRRKLICTPDILSINI